MKSRGVMARLRSDTSGNVLAIVGAALVPLAAMIGAGVDMSRAYVTRVRLQQACDAGALAVRRNITGNTVDDASRQLGQQFFNVNFPTGVYGTTNAVFNSSNVTGNATAIGGSASVTMPNVVMPIVGFRSQQISVNCQASQDFVNTDVVLVLDNTGSMNCAPSDDGNGNCPSPVSGSKIQGQRDAVMSLYDTLKPAQDALAAKGLRLRYGIVPYAQTVNVGKLLYGVANSAQAIAVPGKYQVCDRYNGSGTCTAAHQVSATTHNSSWYTSTWNGCIEERKSNNTITSSTSAIPTDAWDLNIDMMPSAATPGSQWSALDDNEESAGTSGSCPAQAVRLTTFDRTTMQNFVNGMGASGGTYSDVGMIWGGRLISENGIFADSPTSYNSFPVSKYVIVMTDGYISTSADYNYYAAYGVERFDHRVSGNSYPGGNTDNANHKQRFSLMCNAIKSKGVQVWVIGFGGGLSGGLDTTLQNCASSPDQAAAITDSTALIAKFADIGKQIGALRVTQ